MEKHLILVFVLAFIMAALAAMVTPYIPLYGEDIGLPVATIGYLVALYHLAQFLGRIPMGTFSDVVGYRKMITFGGLSLFFAAIFYILSPLVPPFLFLAQVFLGITVCMEWVTLPAYVSRFGNGKIPMFTFVIGWAYTFSIPLGGFFKDEFGMDFLFYLALIVSLISLFLIGLLWKMAPAQQEDVTQDFSSQSVVSIYKSSLKTLKNQKVLRASLYSFLMFLNLNISFSLFPLRLSRLGLSAAVIGLVQFCRAGSSSSIRLLSDRIRERVSRDEILRFVTLSAGVSLILVAFIDSFVALVFISLVWGLSSGLYAPVVFGMITDGTSVEDRGKGMGIRGTVGTFGSFIGIILFSNIAEALSVSIAIFLAGFSIIAGVVALEFVLKKEYIKIK